MGSCVDFNADEANSWSRGRASARRLLKRLCLPVAVALPGIAGAEFRFNFPDPVTPVARETLNVHNEFMLIITILFVAVFGIMIYSMIKHRKSSGQPPADFTAPTGRLQWFWALVPFAILLSR